MPLVSFIWVIVGFVVGCVIMAMAITHTRPALTNDEFLDAVDRIVVLVRSEHHRDQGIFYDRVRELMQELHRYMDENALLISLSKEMLEIVTAVKNKKNERQG